MSTARVIAALSLGALSWGVAQAHGAKWYRMDLKEVGLSFSMPDKPKLSYQNSTPAQGDGIHSLKERIYAWKTEKYGYMVTYVPLPSSVQGSMRGAMESDEGKRAIGSKMQELVDSYLQSRGDKAVSSQIGTEDGLLAEYLTCEGHGWEGEFHVYLTPRFFILVASLSAQSGVDAPDKQKFFDSIKLPKADS